MFKSKLNKIDIKNAEYRKHHEVLKVVCFSAFSIFLAAYLVIIILDEMINHAISSNVDMGIFAAVLLATGFLSVITGGIPPTEIPSGGPARSVAIPGIGLAALLSVLSGVIVFSQALDLGRIAYIVSMATGLIVFFFAMQMLEKEV